MTIPVQCQGIADSIADMEAERRDFQAELQQAATGQKAFLAAQIKALNRKIAVAHDQLTDCLQLFPPPPPPPPPLEAVFSGTATITTTNSSAPGPYSSAVQIGLLFDSARTFVAITSFPTIATDPFDTPFGPNVTTVTKNGGGFGSYAGGSIAVPLGLHFDQSIDLPFFEEDSDLSVGLSTNPPGSPVDSNGAVTLAGSGVFGSGFLNGATGTLTIAGTISPVP
jgi:hypothetical protein